jgi:hypothetical protein
VLLLGGSSGSTPVEEGDKLREAFGAFWLVETVEG